MSDLVSAHARPGHSFRQTKFYDLICAVPVIVWFSFCAWQLLPLMIQQIMLASIFVQTDASVLPLTLILKIVSKLVLLAFYLSLVVLFAIRYVPRARAEGFWAKFAAVAGTFLGVGIVLLPPQELSTLLYVASLLLIVIGFVLALWSSANLGRSISILPEARKIVTTGPYSVIRHPLYLGEMVGTAGVALQFGQPWAFILWGLQCLFQVLRMQYEERLLLKAFPGYADYAAGTARLLPGIY